MLSGPGMRIHSDQNKRGSSEVSFLRDRLDAYWVVVETHMLLTMWIPAIRGLGAARQRADRAMWKAVIAIGKAGNGPADRAQMLLETASDALDTVLIVLDDLAAQGHVTTRIRRMARRRITRLMQRLVDLSELSLDRWIGTSQSRASWARDLDPDADNHQAPTSDEEAAAEARGEYTFDIVQRRGVEEAAALRRAGDPTATKPGTPSAPV